jgi:hypothetical protein
VKGYPRKYDHYSPHEFGRKDDAISEFPEINTQAIDMSYHFAEKFSSSAQFLQCQSITLQVDVTQATT